MSDAHTVPRAVWITVGIATAVMGTALAWGLIKGNFSAEGTALLRMPWGLVSLIEIYVGMALFGCWVFWREASPVRSGAWMLAVALIGNIVSCVYVLLALRCARGNPTLFWMGARAEQEE